MILNGGVLMILNGVWVLVVAFFCHRVTSNSNPHAPACFIRFISW